MRQICRLGTEFYPLNYQHASNLQHTIFVNLQVCLNFKMRLIASLYDALIRPSLPSSCTGITQCIKSCDRLAAQEQIFVKLKVVL